MAAVSVAMFRNYIDEFADADDERIRMALDQASLFVDPLVWSPVDYPWGLIYLAAHLLATKRAVRQAGNSSNSGSVVDSQLFVSSVSIGDRRVSFAKRQSDATSTLDLMAGKLDASSYGTLYAALRRRNAPMVAVV